MARPCSCFGQIGSPTDAHHPVSGFRNSILLLNTCNNSRLSQFMLICTSRGRSAWVLFLPRNGNSCAEYVMATQMGQQPVLAITV